MRADVNEWINRAWSPVWTVPQNDLRLQRSARCSLLKKTFISMAYVYSRLGIVYSTVISTPAFQWLLCVTLIQLPIYLFAASHLFLLRV